MHRDYAPRGVKFYYVYKSLAHPELEGDYVQPFTIDERLAHARQASKQLGSAIPWLVDPMDNRLKRALGDRPNSEFVIDSKGTIVRKRAWSDATALRNDLEALVGPVERITAPLEIRLESEQPLPLSAATGVVKRVSRAAMFPVEIEPQLEAGTTPFYAKLRAEVDLGVFDRGQGKLYLGFHLDPLHAAHWNNLYKPLRYELEMSDDVRLATTSGQSPEIDAPSDADPREFLVDVNSWPAEAKIRLRVYYAACTDEECHLARQEYVITRRRDRDGGRAGPAGFRVLTADQMVRLLLEGDADGDGKLTRAELTSVLRPRFADYDLDGDDVLSPSELRQLSEQQTESQD